MAGVSISIDIDDSGVRTALAGLSARMNDLRPVMAEFGEILLESVQRNFEEHRAPDGTPWKPLSKRYGRWKASRKGRKLTDILLLNRILKGSIHPKVESRQVVVGTNTVYAAIHQFGGTTGRKHAAMMPARPFLGFRADDMKEIREAIEGFLLEGLQK